MITLLDFENAILDLFENNRITIQDAKIVLWTFLTAIYEDELIEEPQRRETVIENIERQKEQLLIFWGRDEILELARSILQIDTRNRISLPGDCQEDGDLYIGT
jgi:hypothetical protein